MFIYVNYVKYESKPILLSCCILEVERLFLLYVPIFILRNKTLQNNCFKYRIDLFLEWNTDFIHFFVSPLCTAFMYSHYKKLNILKTLVSLSYCFWRKKFRFVVYVVSLIFSNCSYNVHNYSQLFNYYLKNLIHISFKKNFNQKLGLQIFSEQLVYAFSYFIFLKSFVSFPKRYNLINKKCFFPECSF